ncbi:conserved phage C-terminal domain-containing protein [Limosilactobacillus fermentum]|uniref:conserved phage C-terminal domain-containing protein n=1 Tax=Limosilactobacillus fermentum TaxID=1613 RepID=UPI00210648D5|nr:conserved phage C-terminal domain-containing protein [Limosilactobacillus fermentum]MCQ2007955.1 conserved phage C-terminal domain-containing protein [Limosilactobacillus fermentum]
MAEYKGANLFLNIPVRVAHDNRLKDKDKLLYGEIYAMLNVTDSFFMSNAKLAERLNCSEPTIKRSLARLEEYGFIQRNNIYEGKQIVRRNISLGGFNSDTRVGSSMTLPPVHERSEGSVISDPDNRTINRASNRAEEDILSGKPDHAPYQEILDYLNSKVGTSYRASSKATQRLIKARSNEGFEVEDFKRVIDNKVASWGKDPKMSQYLRPNTLFGTKFEAYLNEQTVIDQPTKRAKGYTF